MTTMLRCLTASAPVVFSLSRRVPSRCDDSSAAVSRDDLAQKLPQEPSLRTASRGGGSIKGWNAAYGQAPLPSGGKGPHNALRLGISTASGNTHTEDRFAYDELFIAGQSVFMLSVFDGHGGWQVSNFLEREVGTKFRELAVQETSTEPAAIENLLRKGYAELEEKLRGRVARSMQIGFDQFVRVGSCAITVAVTDTHYVCANAGDCRALLCSSPLSRSLNCGKVTALSRTHNANDPTERDRIRKAHPDEKDAVRCVDAFQDPVTKELFVHPFADRVQIEANCYVKGLLQPSRNFGYFPLKRADMNVYIADGSPVVPDAKTMPYTTSQPEVLKIPRTAQDEMLIIGSDGLYDFMEDQEIVNMARTKKTPEAAAQALVDEVKKRAKAAARLTNAEYRQLPEDKVRDVHDDITVLVFFLKYPQAWIEQWSELSHQLQDLCDSATEKVPSLKDYNFSVCVADPSLKDCPLVAVSKGFEELTGYSTLDAIGKNCRFLSFGVPEHLRDKDTTERLKIYTEVATSGDPFSIVELNVSPPSWAPSAAADSAAYFLRWNRRQNGELFLNLFLLRQVWVGAKPYIVALQTHLPGASADGVGKAKLANMDELCGSVANSVLQRMGNIEALLTPRQFAGERESSSCVAMKSQRSKRSRA